MTTQRIMLSGQIDQTGTTNQNGIYVDGMASRYPLRWAVHCVRCNSSWVEDHSRIQYAACRNAVCGRVIKPRTPGAAATVGVVPVAVRSRDSDSIREYLREGQ
jgi:hypothetical protein